MPALKIIPFDELMSHQSEIEWLVEGLIPIATTGFIAGRYASGKSWITQDLVLSLATGKPWLDYFSVKQGTVLVIDEENAQPLLTTRFSKLLKGRGIKTHKLPIFYSVKSRMNFSPDKNGRVDATYTSLLEWCDKHAPSVIICDSLTRVHRNNEDKSSEMSQVFANIDKVVQRFKCTVMLTHHAGHNGDRMKGTIDIYNASDWTIFVNKTGKAPKELITVTQDKGRWDKEIDPFKVVMNGSEDSFRVLYSGSTSDKNALDKESQAIVTLLKRGPMERSECIEKSGIFKSTFDRRRKELYERGIINQTSSAGNIILSLLNGKHA